MSPDSDSGSESGSNKNKPPLLISFAAGGIAGGVEAAMTYPFEFAKTRAQLYHDPAASRNPFVAIIKVYKEEGIRALYKGCSSLIVGSIAKDATRFICFDSIKHSFADPETGALTPIRNMLAGMAAGIVASITAVTPTERIKTALIDDARHERRFKSTTHAIRLLIHERGFRALYDGFGGTTLKQASATSVRFGSYNILKEFERSHNIPQANTLINFGNGMIAGTITVYTTQPFDTIKTRSQSAKGAGMAEATAGIWREAGIGGFWRGSVMRLGRVMFAGGIVFTTYEEMLRLMKPLYA